MKKTARITLRLSPEQKKNLEDAAREHDRTASWLAVRYIERGLAADGYRTRKEK